MRGGAAPLETDGVIPEIRYAKSADGLDIAYLVYGDEPIDLVLIPAWVSHLEMRWERPEHARLVDRLASFARVLEFDKRGSGLSSRLTGAPDLETRMDDLRTVLDAAGSERAAIQGDGLDGTALAAMFAATYPGRTTGLILWGPGAKGKWAPDYPWGTTESEFARGQKVIEESWGTESATMDLVLGDGAPSWAEDVQALRWGARYYRNAATPGDAAMFDRIVYELDVRGLLPSVAAPTLVLYRDGWKEALRDEVRHVAHLMPQAKPVGLHGSDFPMFLGDQEETVAEIQEFLTGTRPVAEPDRILATVLFTDIVGSTEKATELGDARWKELLAAHDDRVRAELRRHRGREVKTTGDGILATFDGPARAVRCARAIVEVVRPLGVEIRAGVHTGEIELVGADVAGVAVHIGARVAGLAGPGEVLVSSTVKDLTAGSARVRGRGRARTKGNPRRVAALHGGG